MKYSINYYRSSKGETGLKRCKPDELKIKYRYNTSEILGFAANPDWDNMRLVVDFTEYDSENNDFNEISSTIFAAMQRHKGETAWLITPEQRYIKSVAKSYNENFFFSVLCDDWLLLRKLIEEGVSDVYITGTLAFDMKAVSRKCHEKGVNVRVFPNMAQAPSIWENEEFNFTSFFIRPDDVKLYEDYIDIFEFVCPLDRQPTLCKIYRQGYWKGDLADIINNLCYAKNEAIIPGFAENRLNCRMKCIRDVGIYQCKHCTKIQSIAEKMESNGLTISKEKSH